MEPLTTSRTIPPLRPDRIHLRYLDSLRGLAALYVVLHHMKLEVWPEAGLSGVALAVVGLFRYGRAAVALFIVMSGFSLMLPTVRSNGTLLGGVWNFYRKRARRILPPYYSALALSLLLIAALIGHKTGTHWDTSLPVTPTGVLAHLLMLQDIFSYSQINHVFWTVAVEWKVYFFFPLLVLGWRHWGPGASTAATAAAAFILFFLLHNTRWVGLTPQYLLLFTLGMLAATVSYSPDPRRHLWRDRLPWGFFTALTAGMVVLLDYHWRLSPTAAHAFVLDLLEGGSAFMLLIAASRSGAGPLRRLLEWRPLVFLGTFAYSLYLLHAPLIQVFWQYALHPLHIGSWAAFALLLFVGTPLIVSFSYLFFLVCERPFLNTRQHETMTGTARDAARSPAP